MSVDLHVFLDPSRLPSPDHWANAAREAGFDVDLDIELDPKTFAGFLPCKYQGKEAGFEYFFQVLSEKELTDWGIGDRTRPACVSFTTRSNYREFASSMIASSVLCSITDGVLRDADGQTLISSVDAIQWARDGEASIQGDIAEQDNPVKRPPVAPPVSKLTPRRPWWRFW